MDERTFFDKLAPTWDDNEVRSTHHRVSNIINMIDINPGQHVLDLGTGTGVLLPYITEKIGSEGKVTAVDYSAGMLDIARQKFSNLSPAPCFLNLDFENETIPGEFHRIILYCVYPHLHDPVNTLRWLEKVNLKENGTITIAFPSDAEFINNIHREKHSESEMLPSPAVLAEFLASNGFDVRVLSDTADAYVVTITKNK
ncbi:MAG: methyltransferase domain-containing protein [Muribaculaceae bacterium]|nr:methyltransferase domain-containing protein [Muribaculaceae bacterium]